MFFKKLLLVSGLSVLACAEAYAMKPSSQSNMKAKKEEISLSSDSKREGLEEDSDSGLEDALKGLLLTERASEKVQPKKSKKNANKTKKTSHSASFTPQEPTASFEDIVQGVPRKIGNLVRILNNSEKYPEMANKKHMFLLEGPPGTGKSVLAEAVAYELKRKFYKVIGSEFVTKYQGSGAKNIRKLFRTLKKSDDPAVLFIDEVDALANKNIKDTHGDTSSAITQLQTELEKPDLQALCILATNNLELIPQALKDRFAHNIITIDLPDYAKRLLVLQHYVKNLGLEDSQKLEKIASITDGLSCRVLEKIVDSAQELAIGRSIDDSDEEDTITHSDLKLAAYELQDAKPLNYRARKLLIEHYAQEHEITLSEKLVHLMATETEDFKSQEIESLVKKSRSNCSFRRGSTIRSKDFYAALYHTQTKKYAPVKIRVILLDYYLERVRKQLSEDIVQNIMAEAQDNFTGQDIQTLVEKAQDIARTCRNSKTITDEDLYVSLYGLLLKKAIPCAVEPHDGYSTKLRPLDEHEKAQLSLIGGYRHYDDKFEARPKKIVYVNKCLPSKRLREVAIKHILRSNQIKFNNDANGQKLVTNLAERCKKLSCYYLKLLLEKTIELAFSKDSHNPITEEYLVEAARQLDILLPLSPTIDSSTCVLL